MKINLDHKQYPEYLLFTAICNSDATLSSISRFVIPFVTFRIVGYCNGLICGIVCYGRTIYLWNPSIGKCKTLTGTSLPVKAADTFKSALGFAYHSESDDYKIVRIVGWLKQNVIEAEVYTLSTDMWRRAEVSLESLRRFGADNSIFTRLGGQPQFVNGALHWSIGTNDQFWYLSFDVDTERFGEIMPPPGNRLEGFLTEFKGLLALVVCGQDRDHGQCFIWVMSEYGVVKSWVKLIVPLELYRFFGCTNNGQLLIESYYDDGKLCLFDPETLHNNSLDVHNPLWAAHTSTFVESLVLLDQV